VAGRVSRSAQLLSAQAKALDRALAMRFVREVHAGTISDQAYANYLYLEAGFVVTAARLHGFAAWDAPSWPAVRRNGVALHALVTEQAEYFRAARAGWPVPAKLGAAASRRAHRLSKFALGRRPRRRLPGDHDRVVRRRDALPHLGAPERTKPGPYRPARSATGWRCMPPSRSEPGSRRWPSRWT